MTRHFVPSGNDATAPNAILIAAARCWRDARDDGRAVQPYLYRMLVRNDVEMLAPLFDSLMTLCEAALGRAIVTGEALTLSDDEHLLLGLFDGTMPRHICLDCAAGTASALDCAICSAQIMLGLVPGSAALN